MLCFCIYLQRSNHSMPASTIADGTSMPKRDRAGVGATAWSYLYRSSAAGL